MIEIIRLMENDSDHTEYDLQALEVKRLCALPLSRLAEFRLFFCVCACLGARLCAHRRAHAVHALLALGVCGDAASACDVALCSPAERS